MNQRIAGMVVVGLIASGLIGAGCDRSTLSSSKADSTDEAVAVEANRASGTQTPPKQPETQTTPAAGQPPGEHIDYDDVPATKAEPNLDLTAAEWKKRLSPQEFQIMRQSGTERAFSGELLHNDKPGTYVCGGCGKRLFSSDTKFKSGTGWPSFFQALEDGSVGLVQDPSGGMERIEVYCTNCGAHLGHLFNDGPDPTGLRYCLDSASLDFHAAKN